MRQSLRFPFLTTLALMASLAFSSPAMAAEPSLADNVKLPLPQMEDKHSDEPSILSITVDRSVPITLERPAASIFIANPEIADIQVISPTSIMVYGIKDGQTTLQVKDDNGMTMVYNTIIVSQSLANLRRAIKAAIPNSDIEVESVPSGLILTGSVKDPTEIEDARRLAVRYIPKDGDIINRIRARANNQVEIRVRFAEVTRDVDKRFGFNWNNLATIGSTAFSIASGNPVSAAGALGVGRTTIGDSLNDAFSFTNASRHVTLNGVIDALAKDGFVTILAEPSLTAMSGQTASFLAGGEFPIPVPQSSDTITIEWKQYGVSLAFTPTILGEDRINLHVRPEVSQLSDAGAVTLFNIEVPALTTRRAETTVELASGQSFALAGLLNNQQVQSVKKFPFLGDMPVLGPLFRSSRFQNNETELVIIITPYIVTPTTQEELALPTDGFSSPSDVDMLFKMRNSGSDAAARKMSGESRAMKIESEVLEDSPLPAPKAPEAPAPAVPKATGLKPHPSSIAPVPTPKEVPVAAPQKAVLKPHPSSVAPVPAAAETKKPKEVIAEEAKKIEEKGAAPAPAPQSKPVVSSKTSKPAPAGPGGFIVE